MILVINNSDSFTCNLVQCLGEFGEQIQVRRKDAVTLDELAPLRLRTGSGSDT